MFKQIFQLININKNNMKSESILIENCYYKNVGYNYYKSNSTKEETIYKLLTNPKDLYGMEYLFDIVLHNK